jgi:homeobox protein ESX1
MSEKPKSPQTKPEPQDPKPAKPAQPKEIGGPTGPEPTRYGDWERNGRVSDF